MNWIEVVLIIIIGLSGFRAYQKGFLLSLFSVFSLILTLFLAVHLFPIGSQLLAEHTPFYDTVKNSVSTTLQLDQHLTPAHTREEQMRYINSLPLPQSMKENLLANNNQEVYQLLEVQALEDYISGYIARITINILSFLIIFIGAYIAILLGIRALDLISKLPVLNTVNKLLGLVFGLVVGVLRIWLVFLVLTFFSTNPRVAVVFDLIYQSEIASFLYNNNLVLKAILDLTKIIF